MTSFETSLQSGPHAFLKKMEGTWSGITRTWLDPSSAPEEAMLSGTIQAIMDDKFIRFDYTSSILDKSIEGIMYLGYQMALQRYELVWMDSFHTGTAIMFFTGEEGAADCRVKGSYFYVAPGIRQEWGWRTEFEMPDDNSLVIRAFNIAPEGPEEKATETVLSRKS